MSRADVEKWNRTIHGKPNDADPRDRFRWVEAATDAIERGDEPPPFPSRMRGTHAARVETLTRLLAKP